jgi:hypothetical protein
MISIYKLFKESFDPVLFSDVVANTVPYKQQKTQLQPQPVNQITQKDIDTDAQRTFRTEFDNVVTGMSYGTEPYYFTKKKFKRK